MVASVGGTGNWDVSSLVCGEQNVIYIIRGMRGIKTKHIECVRFLTSIEKQEN